MMQPMNTPPSNMAETKALLADLAREAAELKQAAEGPVAEVVADWLAPQYLLAAREKLPLDLL
jgi:hypothetical protein